MPIIDNCSQHILFGLLWLNVDHVCCLLPLKGPLKERTEIQIPRIYQALWQGKKELVVNSTSQVVSATLDGCATVPRSTEPRSDTKDLQKHSCDKASFCNSRGCSKSQRWKKNNLCVIVQSSSAFGRSKLLHSLNLAASIGVTGRVCGELW